MSISLFAQFLAFCALVTLYHVVEYALAKFYHPHTTTTDSFLVTKPYLAAMAVGVTEFWIEAWLFPSLKSMPVTFFLGLLCMCAGDSIRKCAIVTAKHNFTHQIAYEKRTEHKLVTSGIYSVFRHPSYFGWYLWAVGSQIMLANPLSIFVFAYAAHSFFADRIPHEEEILSAFFGQGYVDYMRKVPHRIPFIP